jgi:hypothetical protein
MTILALLLAVGQAAPLDVAVEQVRETQRLVALDQTAYPASPYATPAELPATVEVETCWQGFNDYYYFALVDGKIWYKPRHKRPAGSPEWRTDLPWKPFGLNDGLPYRLANKKAEDLDTTFADGMRNRFVEELHFETAQQSDVESFLTPADWEASGAWPHDEPLALSSDFPQVSSILCMTADDDELAVLGDNRQMFYRRKVANLFVSTEWYDGWGQSKDLPVWFPEHLTDHRGWSIGRITAFGAGYKEGPDDRIFEWGPAAVSMETMVWLSPNGRVIYYLDSGTPPVVEHFVEAPFRGQWRGEGIDSSASTIALIDRFGAVYTKIADFDLLGSTPTHPYCYFDDCDDEVYYPPGDIRSGMSDIRLPAEDWRIHDPILPPDAWHEHTWLSDRVTVVQTGKGNAARELRVLGSLEGSIGTFHKAVHESTWLFRPAPAGDKGFEGLTPLTELQAYSDPAQLAALHGDEPTLDRELVGLVQVEDKVLGLRVLDYNPMASPWHVEVSAGDTVVPLELHVVQAWNKFMSPPHGHHDVDVLTWETTLAFDWVEVMRALGGAGGTQEGVALRQLLESARNVPFGLLVNATEHGLELRSKKARDTGRLHAVALRPADAERMSGLADLHTRFWGQQRGHMGWLDEVEALKASLPGSCDATGASWAGRVLELEARAAADLKAIREVRREARRFTRVTLFSSGFLYLFQLKTLDAALDATRESRGAEVRPNELRFNVITGITSRIPFLSRNVWQLETRRLDVVKDEHAATVEALAPLLDHVGSLGCG